MSDYIPLARKSRPRNFDEVIGQETPSRTLKNALAAGKIQSAYLFTGPRGIGKTTLARILAKALNCAKALGPNPCLECDSCREVARSSSLDVLEMDAASNTGVDNVREAIIETVGLVPHRDRYKIFIIDEAHMLSNAAFNALLKTLEEPPPRVVFILATTEAAKIPPTIASRCQRFRFKPLSIEVLTKHLESLAKKENISAKPEALALLARAAEGAARDAVSLLDQCRSALAEGPLTESAVRDLLGFAPEEFLEGILKSIIEEDRAALSRWICRIEEEGLDPAQVARDLRFFLHALHRKRCDISISLVEKTEAVKETPTQPALAFLLRRLNGILEELRFSDSPYLTLEVGLFGCLETPVDLAAWVNRLEQLEARLSSNAATPAAPIQKAVRDQAPGEPAEKTNVTAHVTPAIPRPGSSVYESLDSGLRRNDGQTNQTWMKALNEIQLEKLALATVLGKAEVIEGQKNSWRLLFYQSFDSTQAKKNIPLIEAALTRAAGSPATIKIEEKTQGAAAPLPANSQADGSLSKAQQILGGRFLKPSSTK